MSIYGGFSTRVLESTYNTHICNILNLLQNLLLSFLQRKKAIEIQSFSENFCDSYSKIVKLEQQKHLVPKYSEFIRGLDEYLRPVITEKQYDKESDRRSLDNFSALSLGKESNYSTSRRYNTRQTSISDNRSRKNSCEITRYRKNSCIIPKYRKKHKIDTEIKGYQDKILKSILKDLSEPFGY